MFGRAIGNIAGSAAGHIPGAGSAHGSSTFGRDWRSTHRLFDKSERRGDARIQARTQRARQAKVSQIRESESQP